MPTRILLADDHPLFRLGLREALAAAEDLDVIAEAADGRDALALALREDVDLAILDVVMPRMTGVQVAAELARRRPTLRVLMLSAYEGEQFVAEALAAGASGYVLKSVAEAELAETCRAVMRGESAYPAAHAALVERHRTSAP